MAQDLNKQQQRMAKLLETNLNWCKKSNNEILITYVYTEGQLNKECLIKRSSTLNNSMWAAFDMLGQKKNQFVNYKFFFNHKQIKTSDTPEKLNMTDNCKIFIQKHIH